MPRGSNPGRPPFQKGNQLAKGHGRPRAVPKEIRLYTREVLANAINKLMTLSVSELRKVYDNPNTPTIEVIVARGMLHDKFTGEMGNFDKILDRVIGKVPQRQEISGAGGVPLVPPQIIFETSGSISKQDVGST